MKSYYVWLKGMLHIVWNNLCKWQFVSHCEISGLTLLHSLKVIILYCGCGCFSCVSDQSRWQDMAGDVAHTCAHIVDGVEFVSQQQRFAPCSNSFL